LYKNAIYKISPLSFANCCLAIYLQSRLWLTLSILRGIIY
jgi:hypothetical protein